MQFGLLGTLVVHDGVEERRVPGERQRILLAALLLRAGQTVSIDDLILDVWDGRPPAAARTALHNHVAALRRAIGAAAVRLVTRPPGYAIELEEEELDVERFASLCDQGRAALAVGEYGRCSALLRSALGCWRGEPLLDAPSERLRDAEVRYLAERRDQAVEMEIDANLALGRVEQVIPGLRRLVAAEPLRERLHERLVRALTLAGRTGDALGAYQDARRVLVEELGIEPGPGLRELQARLLADEPAAPEPAGAPAAVPDAAERRGVVPAQLPADLEDFTGRSELVRVLHGWLSQSAKDGGAGPAAVGVIGGAGGIGKSTLAIHVGHRVAERFPDGQLYVNLHGASEAPLSSAAALRKLLREISPEQPASLDAEELAASFRTALAGRRMLIVLDDARDSRQIRPLIPGRSGSRVLITTRNRLADLSGARHFEVGVMSRADGYDLLARIIGDARTHTDPEAVDDLLGACAGLPLALRIVAARLASRPAWTPRYFAERLADRRHRLRELRSGDLAVQASFEASYASTAAREDGGADAARAFRLLGLATDTDGADIGLHAMAALLDLPVRRAEDALEQLVDTHLLEVTAPCRYRAHDLLRTYAAQLAQTEDPAGERAAALGRMLRWYLHTAHAAIALISPGSRPVPLDPGRPPEPELGFRDRDDALRWCEAERTNLTAAIERAAEQGQHAVAWRLACVLQRWFNLRSYWPEWLSSHETGLRSARLAADRYGQSLLLGNLGLAHMQLHRYEEAARDTEAALAIRREIGDRYGEGASISGLALIYHGQGRFDEAVDQYRQALGVFRELGSVYEEAIDLNNLAECHREAGRPADALASVEHCLALNRTLGSLIVESNALDTRGSIHLDLGRPAEALADFEGSAAAGRASGNRWSEAVALQHSSRALACVSRLDEARETWHRARLISEEIGTPDDRATPEWLTPPQSGPKDGAGPGAENGSRNSPSDGVATTRI